MSENRISTESWDVAVVGGGLAGGVAAFHAARRGLTTVVFEKEKAPHHKVCGEFVSGEGIPFLEELGIDLARLGAVPIRFFKLHGPQRSCEGRLPIPAVGISRLVLDEVVLRKAADAGAEIRRGTLVREKTDGLEGPTGSILLETADEQIRAQRLVLATGKHEFRTVQHREGRDSGYVGFKMHLKLKPSMARQLRGHVELFVFKHGYGGISPIEEGLANFCFLFERTKLRSVGTDWDSLAHYIARNNWEASRYLDGADPQFRHFVSVPSVPYGFLRRERPEPGLFCVGDQMAVIPSLTGDGMTIAMMTGRAAAQAIADGEVRGRLRPATMSIPYQREMRSRLRSQVDAAYQLHVLFRNPSLLDWSTYAVNAFPGILDFMFQRTRCQTDVPRLGGDPLGAKRLEA